MKPTSTSSSVCLVKIILCLSAAFTLFSCASKVCPLEDVIQEANVCTSDPCPPKTPTEGPASSNTLHAAAETLVLEQSFWNSYRSFLYLPSAPVPKSAPILLFLHGYFDSSPDRYDPMLRYYARQGYIVIYPTFGNALYAKNWSANAQEALRRALLYLDDHSTIKADRENMAIVGHSIGGILAFRLANELAKQDQLPKPKLLVTSDAAGISTIAYSQISIDNLENIPASTKIMTLMAEETYKARFKEKDRCEDDSKEDLEDNCSGFSANLRALRRTPQVPRENKIALVIPTEKRGTTEFRSDHNAAQAECQSEKVPLTLVDSWGYWRYTHAALESVLKAKGDFQALSGDDLRQDAKWSDGQALQPVLSLTDCFQSGECPKTQ